MPRGRPKGSKNKSTEAREALLAAGIDPLTVMLDNMRHAYGEALEAEKMVTPDIIKGVPEDKHFERVLAVVKRAVGYRKVAQECAEGAAKYCHAALQNTTHTGDEGGPIRIEVAWKV